jgi:ElaB/YqjD/DUF883 family membrane-anchored ribosome-binding protein
MAEEPDVIRHQIDETRESLTEKLETLEGQVKGVVGTVTETIETVRSTVEDTVESVKSGVESTVNSVKETLNETVDSVKETFDVPRQVERHPWAALGCSFLAGMASGYVVSGMRSGRSSLRYGIPGIEQVVPGYQPARPAAPAAREYAERPSFLSTLLEPFAGEMNKIKQTAIGALVGVGRDLLKQSLPESLSANVTEIMDDVARRMGGEPVRGPVLSRDEPSRGEYERTMSTY